MPLSKCTDEGLDLVPGLCTAGAHCSSEEDEGRIRRTNFTAQSYVDVTNTVSSLHKLDSSHCLSNAGAVRPDVHVASFQRTAATKVMQVPFGKKYEISHTSRQREGKLNPWRSALGEAEGGYLMVRGDGTVCLQHRWRRELLLPLADKSAHV